MQSWQFSLHNFKIFTWFFRMMNLLQLLPDQIQVTVQHLLYHLKVQLHLRGGHRLLRDRLHPAREVRQHLPDLHLLKAMRMRMRILLEILHLLKKRVMEDSQISPILIVLRWGLWFIPRLFSSTLGQKLTFYPKIPKNLILEKCDFCEIWYFTNVNFV